VWPDQKNIKDFLHLIGMVYRDDEDKFLHATKRGVAQRKDIVCYRWCVANRKRDDVVEF